jgi:cyclophilin family peptidyl-prolyl cis-trans isomerase
MIGILAALVLTLAPASADVKLGEAIKMDVTLENPDKEEFKGPALVIDSRSIVLNVNDSGYPFTYTQTNDEAPLNSVDLKAGEKATATIEFTPINAGKYTIEANYAGKAAGKASVTVTPLDGATRVGVLLDTNEGPITIQLLPETAPNTAAHFANLARKGFYNGLGFHRIIKNFMAQGGDPKGNGQGGPGYQLPAEFSHDKKYSHTYGRLSMARTQDPDSAGSQFFMCFGQATFLDGKYTVFGEVFDGMDSVKKIESVGAPSDPGRPSEVVTIKKATLVPIK